MEYFSSVTETGESAFSIDEVDLFYSFPHEGLFASVRECIDRNGVLKIQNACGDGVEGFMKLLMFYLESTFVQYDSVFYLQRDGICIGAWVGPVLCDIF